MRLGGVCYRKYVTKQGARWIVRWRVYPAGGGRIAPSKGGFPTKGVAQEWAKVLRRAEAGVDGWSFGADGKPFQAPPAAPHGADRVRGEASELVLEAVRAYAVARFPECKPSTRTKTASVLARVVAHTLADPDDVDALHRALHLHPARLDLTEPAHRAAVALREAVLVRDPRADVPGGPHDDALAWLTARSLPLHALAAHDARLLGRLWDALVAGRAYETGRTHWATLGAFVHWCLDTDRFDRDPLHRFAKVRRDPETEIVDPERVCDPGELEAVATRFGEHGWADEGTGVLVGAYAALRIGELRGLDCGDFRRGTHRYEVRVVKQPANGTRRHRDDDATTQPTKGRRRSGGSDVWVPLPACLTGRLDELLARRSPAGADAPVFVGPRGGRLSADTFRDSHWDTVIDELFSSDHRLAGIGPHVLRSFGMTNWLRSGIDYPRCAQWGRWASLKVMLDTYARILPSDEDTALDRLDRGAYGGATPLSAREGDAAAVTDLDGYRRRRSAG